MSSAARAAGSPERQNRLILFGFIGLAGIAAVLVFLALSNFGDDDGGGAASFGGTINVVTVARDVSAGSTITDDAIQFTTLPENGVVDGALTSMDGLSGLVVRQDLARGEQLTNAKLGQELEDGERFLSAAVPVGMRAVSIAVEENTMVGGLVVPGDRVDIIVLLAPPDSEDTLLGERALTLLQDIEVLAVAQNAQEPITRVDRDGNPIESDTASGSLAGRPSDTEPDEDAKTVTLAVSPEDAALLALTQSEDQDITVFLSLRPEGDRDIVDVPVAELDQ